MRSINGLGWRPALAPLTEMERISIDDGVSVCLREMERTLGYQVRLKEYFLSDAYRYDNPVVNAYEKNLVFNRSQDAFYESVWDQLEALYGAASPWTGPMGYLHWFDDQLSLFTPPYTAEQLTAARIMAVLMVPIFLGTPPPTTIYDPATEWDIIEKNAREIYWPIRAQERADQRYIPDPCREVHYFTFETLTRPEIKRYVEIRSIPGVTSVPVADVPHYVFGHDDFTFTLTFPGDEPLRVIATGTYSRHVDELHPTALGDGRYSYRIRQVVEPWTVSILNEPASGVGNEPSSVASRVWSHAGTLYIKSPTSCPVSVYTLSGALARRLSIPPGQSRLPLERGLYIVELNGTRHKVAIR
jgi:hypothetical protein